MPVQVQCSCGKSYNLRDEFVGKTLQCPQCGGTFEVGKPAAGPAVDPAFDRDKFLLRQKALTINEKYYAWDENGRTVLFIERPAHLLRNLGAILAAIATFFVTVFVFVAIADLIKGGVGAAIAILGFIIAIVATAFVGLGLSKKRHTNFYRDDTKGEMLLQVFQDKKFQPIVATYTIADAQGNAIGYLRKNYLYNIFRKRWVCLAPDGATQVCMAMEDSIILSLLRRFLGPLFGVLRTNFIIVQQAGGDVLGEFNRKFTLLDRYVLDMTGDPHRLIDRRIAIALGVMLDTGERR
ncbi:hypothetical protein LLG95_04460 [bacterium]|nr:hypothetical protein [bacterium]